MKKEEEIVLAIEKSSEEVPAAKLIKSVMNCKPKEFYEKYRAYKKAEAEFKEIYEPFKEKLIEMYKKQEILPKTIVIEGGVKTVYVAPSTRTSIDSKKLKEEEPELAKKYTKTTAVDATIRIEGI